MKSMPRKMFQGSAAAEGRWDLPAGAARAVGVDVRESSSCLQTRRQRAQPVVRHGRLPDRDRGRVAAARGDLDVRVGRLRERRQVVVHVERRTAEQRPALGRRRGQRFDVDLLQAAVRLAVHAGEAVAVDVVAHDRAGVIEPDERERPTVRLEVDFDLVATAAGGVTPYGANSALTAACVGRLTGRTAWLSVRLLVLTVTCPGENPVAFKKPPVWFV